MVVVVIFKRQNGVDNIPLHWEDGGIAGTWEIGRTRGICRATAKVFSKGKWRSLGSLSDELLLGTGETRLSDYKAIHQRGVDWDLRKDFGYLWKTETSISWDRLERCGKQDKKVFARRHCRDVSGLPSVSQVQLASTCQYREGSDRIEGIVYRSLGDKIIVAFKEMHNFVRENSLSLYHPERLYRKTWSRLCHWFCWQMRLLTKDAKKPLNLWRNIRKA